jgi:cobalt-zinc-cadmium efflux system membrane fusion protein
MIHVGCKDAKDASQEASMGETTPENAVTLTEAQFKNANIVTSRLKNVSMGDVITLNGKLETMPEHVISVSSPMSGFVKSIKLMPGMTVQKGQVLIRMEDKEYIQLQHDFLTTKSALAYALKDLERQKELSKNQAVSEKAWQQAEEKWKMLQIQLKSLGEKLKLISINPNTLTSDNMTSQITIFSPISGSVTDIYTNAGKYVNPGDELLKIIGNGHTKLVLKAFEKDINYLVAGQKIMATANDQSDKKISGRIDYIIPSVSSDGYTQVICTLDQMPSGYITGKYIKAEVQAKAISSWAVADEAIVNYEGREYLYWDKGNKTFEMAEVQTGQKNNGLTQIVNFDGFMDKEIVVKGAYTLLMKMKNVAE